jgi:magnesium-transporting ATPase (P-type)
MMLTGDNKATAKWVSDQVGLDEYFAEVLPQDKTAKVKEVQSRGVSVAMTGDGVNDAPALAQADVGIAIGAGSDVAVETADVILVRSNPLDVVAIVQLSRATYRKMIQNLVWATGYNVVAIPLAAGALYAWGVLLTPALGAVLMAASTVIVAFNARLLRLKAEPKTEAKSEPKPEAEAKAEAKPEAQAEAKAEVKAEVKAEPKPEPKAETPADLTPQIAKRAYEIYEERSRAVQDWEQAEREIRQVEAKEEPQPEAKK